MNLLYKENLFTSFGHLPVTENAKTGIFWELPTLVVPGVAKVGSSGSCQSWQFQKLPTLAVPGVAKVGNFWTYWNLPKVALEHMGIPA